MYKVASQRAQSAADRGSLADWVHGEEPTDVEAQCRALKDALQGLERQIIETPPGAQRRRLGQRKQELAQQMTALKDRRNLARRQHSGVASYFLNAAREMLQPALFRSILDAALKQHDTDAAKAAATEKAQA